jgi:hypothetical protein
MAPQFNIPAKGVRRSGATMGFAGFNRDLMAVTISGTTRTEW